MAEELKSRRGETAAHAGLKRLALLWAQARGYSVCAFEVQLPRCRFRADLAAYRPNGKEIGTNAIFECKQAVPDLRRDNGRSAVTAKRLEKVFQSLCRHGAASIIPAQIGDSLFAFKDCVRPNLFPVRPVGRQIRAKSTTRQLHFEGADGITARLRP